MYEGKTVKAGDVRFVLFEDKEKVGILLFFSGYTDAQKELFAQLGYLFLDEALGEYSVETQVGPIDFRGQDAKYFADSRPLRELPQAFDKMVHVAVH